MRRVTPARLIALVLVGIVLGGLIYLGVSPGSGAVSVPPGASAGQLSLHSCRYATEHGDLPADCGTLVVPENRLAARSRLIALPVVRIRATSGRSTGTIFRIGGGPGITNMSFQQADRYATDHDVVMVGFRGVDGSTVLNCPEVTSALEHSADLLGNASYQADTDAFRACGRRLTASGVDLAGYGLVQQVDDMETARVVLGYGPVDLLSESEGTRTAAIWAWRYPTSVHRSVMIGVNPPGHFLWYPDVTDQQLQHYGQLCAQDAGCSKRTGDLVGTIRSTASAIPNRWLFLKVKPGDVLVASFFGMFNSMSEAFPSGPMTLDAWLAAANGDPSGLWFMSLAAQVLLPSSFVWGEFAAVGMIDTPYAQAFFGTHQPDDSVLQSAGTRFIWAGGALVGTWPLAPGNADYDKPRVSQVPTLLIGGTLDFTAPPAAATKDLLPYLPNGHQVVLAELGHTSDFWAYQPEASTRLVGTFFDSGKVDQSLYRYAKVDFTPSASASTLAKWIVAILVTLAALTVLSLVWLAVWVRRRGGVGRTAGALLRSLWPVVLGLGGWCLAVLAVFTALPGVPVDDQLLVAVSTGLPVGLGVGLAWVSRGRQVTTGLALALAGGLVGGWLGFGATTGFGALATAIAGATVGANAVLLALDIATNRPQQAAANQGEEELV